MNLIPAIAGSAASGNQGTGTVASFVVDLGRRRLLATDPAARRLWGLPGEAVACDRLPLDLDAGMPALATLGGLATLRSPERDRFGPVFLTFWTFAGVRSWPCLVRCTGDTVQQLAQVIVVEPVPVEREHPRPPAEGREPAAGTTAQASEPAAAPTARSVARLAHELRTPLSAILTMADVLAEQRFGPLPDPRYADYARTIGDTARHAIGVVAAMLAPEQGHETRAEPTFVELDLDAVAAECARSIEGLAARSGTVVDCALSGALPRVIADRVGVQQIVLNLLANGLEHAGAGARLTLRSGCEPGGEAWLEVEDDGPGIPREMTDGAEIGPPVPVGSPVPDGGRGIGLPLADSLARQNGARLVLARIEPHGTRARLSFAASRTIPV